MEARWNKLQGEWDVQNNGENRGIPVPFHALYYNVLSAGVFVL